MAHLEVQCPRVNSVAGAKIKAPRNRSVLREKTTLQKSQGNGQPKPPDGTILKTGSDVGIISVQVLNDKGYLASAAAMGQKSGVSGTLIKPTSVVVSEAGSDSEDVESMDSTEAGSNFEAEKDFQFTKVVSRKQRKHDRGKGLTSN